MEMNLKMSSACLSLNVLIYRALIYTLSLAQGPYTPIVLQQWHLC